MEKGFSQSKFGFYPKKMLFFGAFACLLFLFAATTSAMASTLSETFLSEESLPRGSVVTLSSREQGIVSVATAAETQQVLGVVNDQSSSSITINKNDRPTSVALSGDVNTLVSDVNGLVQQGDTIAISWIDGVGMLAEGENYAVIGVAQEDFDSNEARDYGLVDTPSGKREASVDSIIVRLLDRATTATADNEGIIASVSGVFGKNVSLIRIVIAAGLFVATLIVAGSLVSSSLRGSFISIGRNPMASSSIQQSMIRVATLAALIIVIGTTLSYVVMVF